MSVADALASLAAADQRLAEAQREREEADAQVDRALAEQGWFPAPGAFVGSPMFTNADRRLRTREELIAQLRESA